MFRTTSIYGVVACALLLLTASPSFAVELSIFNELKEYESGNLLLIENARSIESPKTKFRVNIHPGKTVKVTKGNVRTFTLVRPFIRHKLKYEVTCPTENNLNEEVTVSLLEIHKNHLPAGCQVKRLGHWSSRGGMKWKEVEPKEEAGSKKKTLARAMLH